MRKKHFSFGGSGRRNVHNPNTFHAQSGSAAVIPSISSQIKDNYLENSPLSFDKHSTHPPPPLRTQADSQTDCTEFPCTTQRRRYRTSPEASPSAARTGIILNIPLKSNNVRRTSELRAMNHEKFTPCIQSGEYPAAAPRRRLHHHHHPPNLQHENSISNCNETGKYNHTATESCIKMTCTDSDKVPQISSSCEASSLQFSVHPDVKIRPPPRRRRRRRQTQCGNVVEGDVQQPIDRKDMSNYYWQQENNVDSLDFASMYLASEAPTTTTHSKPNDNERIKFHSLPPAHSRAPFSIVTNKSADPWATVNLVDSGKFENSLNEFEDRFVDTQQRPKLTHQNKSSIDIFNRNDANDIFEDFDKIFTEPSFRVGEQKVPPVMATFQSYSFAAPVKEEPTTPYSVAAAMENSIKSEYSTEIIKFERNAKGADDFHAKCFPAQGLPSGNQNVTVNQRKTWTAAAAAVVMGKTCSDDSENELNCRTNFGNAVGFANQNNDRKCSSEFNDVAKDEISGGLANNLAMPHCSRPSLEATNILTGEFK